MKVKKEVKLERSRVQITNYSSSNTLLLKSIYTNIESTISIKRQKHSLKTSKYHKSANQTLYRCGCVVVEPTKLESNCSIEFPLVNSKIKDKEISKLVHSKSLDTFSKIKTNKTIETQKPSKQTIGQPRPQKSRKKLRKPLFDVEHRQLKMIKRKVAKLQQHYEELLLPQSQEVDRRDPNLSAEDIQYVPKEIIRNIQKVRFIQKPVEKVVYAIKKVPKEVTTFKDIIVQVPIHREELVFVDPEPLPPIIKYKSIVNQVEKILTKSHPEDNLSRQQIAIREMECKDLERLISDSLKEIQNLRSFIELERHNRQQLARAEEAHEHLMESMKREINPQQLPSQTSIASHLSTSQKPTVSCFQLEEVQKPQHTTSAITVGTIDNISIIQTQKITEEYSFSRSPNIMRITSEGRLYVGGQQRPSSGSTSQNIIRINSESRTHSNEPLANNSQRQPTLVIRKYCKRGCIDVCMCMSDLMVITTQQKS